MLIKVTLAPALLNDPTDRLGIAVCHSVFNVLCTVILLPQSKLLEKIVYKLVPDDKKPETVEELDERLLSTPPMALERCHMLAKDMAEASMQALKLALQSLNGVTDDLAAQIRALEDRTDHYEDILGSYLVKLSTQGISETHSAEAAGLLRVIGDFERIADHGVNLLESAEEIQEKGIAFTDRADAELRTICSAVDEVVTLAVKSFLENDLDTANMVEPLEQVVDGLKERLRTGHIRRLQKGQCSIEAGFVWADLLTCLERTSDHCSNVAACVIDMANNNMNIHASVRSARHDNEAYDERYNAYLKKYEIAPR